MSRLASCTGIDLQSSPFPIKLVLGLIKARIVQRDGEVLHGVILIGIPSVR